MLYFIYGNDFEKASLKVNSLVSFLQKKKPNASFFKIDTENYEESLLEEYIGSRGLFEEKYIILLSHLCIDKNIKESLLKKFKEISESENVFILFENKLDKATVTKIEKYAKQTQEFQKEEEKTKEPYNAFALADAFGNRDKKNAWILYRQAIGKGEAPEALHGMIFWKTKSLILSSNYSHYKSGDLDILLEKLIRIYHESRRGNKDLILSTESLLLEL